MDSILLAIFYTISLFINWVIYSLAALAYTLFPIMAQLDFSSLTTALQDVINRLEVFLGIFMLFVVAFNLLQYMVDPDKKEGATSKLITKIIVSLVLLVSSSFIFAILDELQVALVNKNKDNIAQTVLFGENNSQSMSDEEIGRRIVYAVFFNMYENQSYPEEYNQVVSGQSTLLTSIKNLWSTYNEVGGKIYYKYPFLSDVFGIFLIIMFITFAIDIGVRNFTLLFLRILFPVVAIGYISPKGEQLLSKYVSTYISTYVQIFVKTFTVYLLLYIFLWFMQALYGGTNEIFDNVAVGDTTKTLLLLLIAVALFMFFTKGIPAILKNIFGIEMDSSLKGAFGKALGLAAAGASLVAGGVIGGAIAKKAGTSVASGVWEGAKGGAQAGWGLGKNVGQGKTLDDAIGAVTKYGKGMYGTHKSIKKNISDNKAKLTERADKDQQNYELSKQQLGTERAILDELEKHKDESEDKLNKYNVQKAKFDALEKKTDSLKEQAQESVNKARGADPNYVSNAEKKAADAEKDFKNKSAAYEEAVRTAEDYKTRFGEDSNEYKRAEASAEFAKIAVDTAEKNAKSAAEEAKNWNSDYNSVILVASANQASGEATVTPSGVTVTPEKATVTPSGVTVTPGEATVTPGEAVVAPGTTATPGETVITPEGTATVPGGNAGQTVEQTSTPGVVLEGGSAGKKDTTVRTAPGTGEAQSSDEPAVVVGGQSGSSGVVEEGTTDGRKDAKMEDTSAENARLRNARVEEIREEFGTGVVSMDEDDNDDNDSEVFEVLPDEEVSTQTVEPADDELETIMKNDIRAYGERASRRFRELVVAQKMDANLAMQTANKEAHDAIKSIAKDLMKEGKSAREAYEEARRKYNEGQ